MSRFERRKSELSACSSRNASSVTRSSKNCSSTPVSALVEDQNGTIWIGTLDNGLTVYGIHYPVGDFLDKPLDKGGLALSRPIASAIASGRCSCSPVAPPT